jgi:hypothetical protein
VDASRDPHSSAPSLVGPHAASHADTPDTYHAAKEGIPYLLEMALRRLVWLVSACVAILVGGQRTARADGKALPIIILSIDSDDGEEQADALTAAMRSRARSSGNFSLVETTQSLSMLTAALKCPSKPDAACLEKIANQVKCDRFIWGTMTKAPGSQVTADLHFFARGRPDTNVRDSYSDNLKDQNDEALRKVAARLFERLTGTATGTVTVHAGDAEGEVWIDGQKRGDLVKGDLTLELLSGPHAMEVRARGYAIARHRIAVASGKNVPVNVNLTPVAEAGPREPETPVPVRRILGWTALGVGVGVAVAGGIVALGYFPKHSRQEDLRGKYPSTLNGSPADACTVAGSQDPGASYAGQACSNAKEWDRARQNAVILAAAGGVLIGTGVIILVTDRSSSSEQGPQGAPPPKRASMRVVPEVGVRSGGLSLVGTF